MLSSWREYTYFK